MKKECLLLVVFIVSVVVASHGYTQELRPGPAYLSDTIKITLRAGQSMDYKIVSLLTVGQKIEILEPGEEWTRVRAANGKEGWLLSSFISGTLPNSLMLRDEQKRLEAFSEKCAALEADKGMLSAENGRLSAEKEALKEQLGASSGETEKQIEALTRENELLRDSLGNRFIKWFLAGAGVLVLGFFVGHQTKRDRHRLY